MAKYHYQTNLPARLQRWRRAHRLVAVILVAVVAGAAIGGYYLWAQSRLNMPVIQSQPQATATFTGNLRKTVSNENFQFDGPHEWTFSRTASTLPNKYVYYNYRGKLVVRELTIYLNQVPDNQAVTYVLPVESQDKRLKPLKISPRCITPEQAAKLTRKELTPKQYMGVNYLCNTDSPEIIIAAGIVGGGYRLKLNDTNGQSKVIGIAYRDVSATPEPHDFENIASSFRLK